MKLDFASFACAATVTFGILIYENAIWAAPFCRLFAEDLKANAALSFDDFDQKGTLTSSFRALENRGCDAVAADAAEDYMLHHPDLTSDERINVMFHEGQARAMAGEERIAAMLIAATRSLDQKLDAPFDWNTYVEGTWAFLVKDRARLEAATTALSLRSGVGNVTNARVLRGLLTCFNRPYKEAYGSASCRQD